MNSLLVILFAVLDCEVWTLDQVMLRVDRLIRISIRPEAWLVDLGACKSIDDCSSVVRQAMRDFGIVLPDNIGDLLAGLVLLRVDLGQLSAEDARRVLVDVVDAYGTSCVDAEAALKIDLKDTVYSEFRQSAVQTLRYLTDEQLSAADRDLIEG